ncbi:MAG: S8 family serine peptidase, partial [Solirubrobacterales bacterium]
MRRGRIAWKLGFAAAATTILWACVASSAFGAFPYTRPGGDPKDFTDLYLTPSSPVPNDLGGDGNTFKFASTPDPANTLVNSSPVELGGVRGAHLADADRSAAQAVQTTLGRPDVTIAVLDSGIEWSDAGAMAELRRKTRLNRGELPLPQADLATAIASPSSNDCPGFEAGVYDANRDAVFNLEDYACDSRVAAVLEGDGRRVGPAGVLTPQDLIIAFSDSGDGDGNGFADDIAGWDFLDDDNDPFDDVEYGHGTGEARDSGAETDNGDQMGTCPNCMLVSLRVGDSFIADVNAFAQATLYATDNDVQVVQEALGTMNNSTLARAAVDYAYRHGVTVIASAADEAAQHNN